MIRTVIADDHPVVRRGLRQVLADTGDISVVAEAERGQEVLDIVRNQAVDVVVLDIVMPDGTGIEVLRTLKREHTNLPVLVLSMHAEDQYGVPALKAGASGYISKATATDQLVTAIRKAAGGGKFISPGLAEKLAYDLQVGSDGPPHERLSPREFQVLEQIALGRTVTEIAKALAVSPKTVSTYRTRILEKMNMGKNAELTHYAIKHGLITMN